MHSCPECAQHVHLWACGGVCGGYCYVLHFVVFFHLTGALQYVAITVRVTSSVSFYQYSSGFATIGNAVTVLNKRLVKQLLCLLFVVYKAFKIGYTTLL